MNFEAWADDEKKCQNVVDTAAVVGLDQKQAASVQAAAAKIAGYIPTMRAAAAKTDPAITSLRNAVALAKKAKSLDRVMIRLTTWRPGTSAPRAVRP